MANQGITPTVLLRRAKAQGLDLTEDQAALLAYGNKLTKAKPIRVPREIAKKIGQVVGAHRIAVVTYTPKRKMNPWKVWTGEGYQNSRKAAAKARAGLAAWRKNGGTTGKKAGAPPQAGPSPT